MSNATLVLSVAYLLTEVLKTGVTWREILDGVDKTGNVNNILRARISADQMEWEYAWDAKRQAGLTP